MATILPKVIKVIIFSYLQEDIMTLLVAKWNNRIVRLVRYSSKVAFSDNPDWLLLQYPLELPENKRRLLWVPLSTRFEWVKEFN